MSSIAHLRKAGQLINYRYNKEVCPRQEEPTVHAQGPQGQAAQLSEGVSEQDDGSQPVHTAGVAGPWTHDQRCRQRGPWQGRPCGRGFIQASANCSLSRKPLSWCSRSSPSNRVSEAAGPSCTDRVICQNVQVTIGVVLSFLILAGQRLLVE